jgi:flagellar basal body-associated protein FliL
MANPETPAEGGGMLPVLIAVALTAVLGLATGFAISAFMMPAAEYAGQTGVAAKSSPQQAAQHSEEAKLAEHGKSETASTGHEETDNAEATEEPIDPEKLAFVPFPPVVVNLREQSDSWVRVEGGIQYITEGEIPEDSIGPLASEIAMNYFRTLTISDFEGGDGLQLIKMDLTEIARSLSKGQIRGFTFTSFIIE